METFASSRLKQTNSLGMLFSTLVVAVAFVLPFPSIGFAIYFLHG